MGFVFGVLQKLGIRLDALQFVIVTKDTRVTGCHVAASGLASLVFGSFARQFESELAKHSKTLGAHQVTTGHKSCTVILFHTQPDSSLLESLAGTTAEACRLKVLVGASMDSEEARRLGVDTIWLLGQPPKS